MGQTYAGAAEACGFGAGGVVIFCASAVCRGEGFGGAGIPSITRFDETVAALFKYPCGLALNFSTQCAQQK
jgi:hypothetical protein